MVSSSFESISGRRGAGFLPPSTDPPRLANPDKPSDDSALSASKSSTSETSPVQFSLTQGLGSLTQSAAVWQPPAEKKITRLTFDIDGNPQETVELLSNPVQAKATPATEPQSKIPTVEELMNWTWASSSGSKIGQSGKDKPDGKSILANVTEAFAKTAQSAYQTANKSLAKSINEWLGTSKTTGNKLEQVTQQFVTAASSRSSSTTRESKSQSESNVTQYLGVNAVTPPTIAELFKAVGYLNAGSRVPQGWDSYALACLQVAGIIDKEGYVIDPSKTANLRRMIEDVQAMSREITGNPDQSELSVREFHTRLNRLQQAVANNSTYLYLQSGSLQSLPSQQAVQTTTETARQKKREVQQGLTELATTNPRLNAEEKSDRLAHLQDITRRDLRKNSLETISPSANLGAQAMSLAFQANHPDILASVTQPGNRNNGARNQPTA